MSINRAILLGNVGADPEIRSMQSGDRVATFRLATSETWRDKATGEKKEATEWHTIVCFNQALVKIIEQYVQKGGRVSVEGAIRTRKWQDRDGNDRYRTEIVIGPFDGRLGLEGSPSGGGAQRTPESYGDVKGRGADPAKPAAAAPGAGDLDDDIPF